MAEAELITFSYKEVVESLIKKQGLHEGLWSLYIEFGIGAGIAGPNAESLSPTAFVPIMKIGIQQTKEPTNLTVDAAEANPK